MYTIQLVQMKSKTGKFGLILVMRSTSDIRYVSFNSNDPVWLDNNIWSRVSPDLARALYLDTIFNINCLITTLPRPSLVLVKPCCEYVISDCLNINRTNKPWHHQWSSCTEYQICVLCHRLLYTAPWRNKLWILKS